MEDRAAQAVFGSEEAKYVQFNFHSWRDAAALADILCGDAAHAKVVLLSGRAGSGRRYLLEAAAYQARKRLRGLQLATIDLDGFEPSQESIEHYVGLQLRKAAASERSRIAELLGDSRLKLSLQSPRFMNAVLFSLSLSIDVPLQSIARLFSTNAGEAKAGPRRPEKEMLQRIIESVTRTHRLVIHLRESAELSFLLRDWFVQEAQANPHLVVAFSCRPHEPTEYVAPYADGVQRFEITALATDRIRAVLDERFHPHEFPRELADILRHDSGGVQGHIAMKMADLMEANLLTTDSSGVWQLAAGVETEEFARAFAAGVSATISGALAEIPAHWRERAWGFLKASALCGRYIPVARLRRYLGIAGPQQDELIDLLDDILVDGAAASQILQDFEYSHPGFPGELVYAFSNPVSAPVILARTPNEERARLAARLIDDLLAQPGLHSRSFVRLLLAVATHLDNDAQGVLDIYAHELNWWFEAEDAEEFSNALAARMQTGETPARDVWRAFQAIGFRWPAQRRLAVLNAFSGAGDLPPGVLTRVLFERAKSQYELGHYDEALGTSRACLGIRELEATEMGALRSLIGAIEMQRENWEGARIAFEESLALSEAAYGYEHAETATSLTNLGVVYEKTGDLARAIALHSRALHIYERTAEGGPNVAACLDNLATVYQKQGEFDRAEKLLRRARDLLRRTRDADASRHLAKNLTNLGVLYYETGRYDEAEAILREALVAWTECVGPEHPELALVLNGLGLVLGEVGRPKEAEELLSQSLAMRERCLGKHHADVANSLQSLGAFYARNDQPGKAEPLLTRAVAILENALSRHHAHTILTAQTLLNVYQTLGKSIEAQKLTRRFGGTV
jgi:tetratricopeptide (TPR) repeat protein